MTLCTLTDLASQRAYRGINRVRYLNFAKEIVRSCDFQFCAGVCNSAANVLKQELEMSLHTPDQKKSPGDDQHLYVSLLETATMRVK